MFHLLNFQKYINNEAKKRYWLEVAVGYPVFLGILGIPGACTGIRTLTKVLESALSESQTD